MPQATVTPEVIVPGYNVNLQGPLRVFFDNFGQGDWAGFAERVHHWWDIYSIIAILLSLVFFIGFVYARIRYGELRGQEEEELRAAERAWANRHMKAETKNARWDLIQQRVAENSPESWRVAIIEADILLDETLTNAGYVGQSIGEKLKTANTSSFTTLQDAWEAHKVRNEIAHVGSDYVLTQRAANETIVRFERVFKEFGIV